MAEIPASSEDLVSSVRILEPERQGCSAAFTHIIEKQLGYGLPWEAFPGCPQLSYYPLLYSQCIHSIAL